MRIAVLSDTHARPSDVDRVLDTVAAHLEGVDHILHAGDVTCPELLEALGAVAPVTAVHGNMDGHDIAARLPARTVVTLGGHRIGLMHGSGAPGGLADRVVAAFLDAGGRPTVDVVVFGHSHHALVERRDGLLVVNPGSPTDRRFAPTRSLVLLDLEPGRAAAARVVPL